MTAISLFGATAAVVERTAPERALAVGVAVLTVAAVLRARTERRGLLAVAPVAAGGVAVAIGLLLDDPDRAALVVVVGAGAVLVAAILLDPSAVLLAPPVLLALARVADDAHGFVPDRTGVDPIGLAGAAMGVLVALALLRTRRRPSERLALTAVAAATVLLAQDLPELRSGGLLVAAGGILALVGRHPVALVAVVPGLAAAVDAFGHATEPAHAAAGAALVAAAVAAGTERRPAAATTTGPSRSPWAVAPAVAFGVLPAWGWSQASPGPYTEAVLTGAAVAVPTLVVVVGWAHPGVTGRPTGGAGRMRIRRGRSSAPPDGSTQATAEDEGAGEEVGVEAGAQPAASS